MRFRSTFQGCERMYQIFNLTHATKDSSIPEKQHIVSHYYLCSHLASCKGVTKVHSIPEKPTHRITV